MNVFSKPLKPKEEIISYIDFFKNDIDISKLKLTELKALPEKINSVFQVVRNIEKECTPFFRIQSMFCYTEIL